MEKIPKPKQKNTHSALIRSPGRWTGNKVISKGGLRVLYIEYLAVLLSVVKVLFYFDITRSL